MPNSRRCASSSSLLRSASDSLRMSAVFVFSFFAMLDVPSCHEPSGDRELVRGQAHRLPRHILPHARNLVDDASGLDHRYPGLDRSLAGALTHFERLLGDRLVREHADPKLATTTHVAGDGTPASLNLARCHPARAQGLKAVIPERHRAAGGGLATHAAALRLAELGPFRL